MLRHEDIWRAIDAFAAERGLTPSALARKAGLDATTFNKSKRFTREGKPRWPSTESIAKVLNATNAEMCDFARHLPYGTGLVLRVPVIGYAQAGNAFDAVGRPVGPGWGEETVPDIGDPNAFALRVMGHCMEPTYREGDIIIASPSAPVAPGHRVVVVTKSGEVLVKELVKRENGFTELRPLNLETDNRILADDEILGIARIAWVQQ